MSLLFLISFTSEAFATVNPLNVPNNKFGIHLADPVNLGDAQKLINSNGGAWGYVTIVITVNNRDQASWQKVFDAMRRGKLIPIVRIATIADGDNWQKPDLSQIDAWVDFLNSLNWVTQNRYIVIGNEPNHAKEWGSTVSPEEYAIYLKTFSEKLKAASSDFYVLPAGLDASAGTIYKDRRKKILDTLDEVDFIKRELVAEPDLFSFIDGWTSHSYPNPGFIGPAQDIGRGTVKTYDWELTLLKSLGIDRSLPVFITETGWIQKIPGYDGGLSEDEIAKRFTFAYQNVWDDSRIVAITPFLLDYPSKPFGNFSWKDGSGHFYKFFDTVVGLPKVAGTPLQIDKGKILGAFIFPVQLTGSTFSGFSLALNEGESIWETQMVGFKDSNIPVIVNNTSFSTLEPGQVGAIYFQGKTPKKEGVYELNLMLTKAGNTFGNFYKLKIVVENPLTMKLMPIFDKILKFFKK